MSCAACGSTFKGHKPIEIPIKGVKRYFTCPAALNDVREERDDALAELQTAKRRAAEVALINENNGAWKRTQQVTKLLRERAAKASPEVRDALNACANDLELRNEIQSSY